MTHRNARHTTATAYSARAGSNPRGWRDQFGMGSVDIACEVFETLLGSLHHIHEHTAYSAFATNMASIRHSKDYGIHEVSSLSNLGAGRG
jgi:hypothetical protein